MNKNMVPPDATWKSDNLEAKDRVLYENLANKLDAMGKLVSRRENEPDHLHSYKVGIYHVPKGTVRLRENTNSSLNQYKVNVQVDVYSNNKKSAEKILESIIESIIE